MLNFDFQMQEKVGTSDTFSLYFLSRRNHINLNQSCNFFAIAVFYLKKILLVNNYVLQQITHSSTLSINFIILFGIMLLISIIHYTTNQSALFDKNIKKVNLKVSYFSYYMKKSKMKDCKRLLRKKVNGENSTPS
jgi:hypothetical protein